ncbi:calcium-activated chloride channel regulator 1 [Halyomorpha halys]|uniref:calcium-activated chloride channel regulator 1 n=1 Tax=Halyomorpha halys TaxID=286706 RepID=UPI0006D4D1B1|nr:calcium-activated chloride channel regulator 1 [Halyomorpha halys]
MSYCALLCLTILLIARPYLALEYSEGTYRGITVAIDPQVPKDNCQAVLNNLESAMSSGSAGVYKATGGRASWKSVTVLVPGNWPDSCVPAHSTVPAQGEKPDIRVALSHPVFRDMPWTQQSKPCGHQGDFIYLSYRLLIDQHHHDIGRVLVREWAKYRYGVFDEVGYVDDSVYPTCYHSDLKDDYQVNGCSDKDISENGMCSNGVLNISSLVHPEAKTSLLFTDSHGVDMFCDATSHDRFAPTKHNNLCRRKSAMQIINEHPDFSNGSTLTNEPINTTPTIIYKRESLTRYVLVIEDTKDMIVRESWSYLRLAVRKWVVVQLQGQVEVALISANETKATLLQSLTPLHNTASRDLLASNVPYTPGDSRAACLHCGMNLAYQLLQERAQLNGPANSVIVVIAPGTSDHVPELNEIIPKLKASHIRVATVTYPVRVRPKTLDWLAEATEGISFTVMETKYNMHTSFISTYFKLTNVMWAIQQAFYQGDKADLPIEIHRKEIVDNGQASVVGSFVLDDWLGEPAKFTVLAHNTENPLIRSITLVSPSHRVYSTRSDALLSLKLLTVPANINETGTWTYTIERFPGSPQPHYVQVMATPRSVSAPVVHARLYTARTQDDLILYTEVKRGDYPVLGAKVEVSVSKQGINGSLHRERFELMDTGSGDPDLMKGDGVYTRYFSASMGGTGDYTFEVTVTDNGNTAYTWQYGHQYEGPLITRVPCCGSSMPAPTVEPLSPFQRILPPLTIHVIKSDAVSGQVGDLRSVIYAPDLKARLVWTAPDMGGKPVTKYELRYARSISDILDNFNSGTVWPYGSPFPLAPGSETTFTLDFTRNPSLLDQTLYFAIRGFSDLSDSARPGPISNWVRVNVPSPPPPPPISTTASTIIPIWPPQEESAIPNLAETFELNLEIILPVIIGLLILGIFIVIYCYFCLRKRAKKEANNAAHPEKPLNVSIVPTDNNSNGNINGNINISHPVQTNQYDMSPQMTNLPQYEVRVEDDPNKRYSLTPYDGVMQNGNLSGPGNYGNGHLTGINEYDNRNNTLVREKTLSPYQSWTASQLLHEHERRQSPYGQMEDYGQYYPPPVPPLPSYQQDIYGANTHLPPPNQFMNYQPAQNHIYNPSLQGSMSSVNSSERKRRNVTMV